MKVRFGMAFLLGAIPARSGSAQSAAAFGDSVLRATAATFRDDARLMADTTSWFVATGDSTTMFFAKLIGVAGRTRPASGARPPCPWTGAHVGDSSKPGFDVAVTWHGSGPDAAVVTVSYYCTDPPGSRQSNYRLQRHFDVGRVSYGWKARAGSISVTSAIPVPPNARSHAARKT